MISNFYSKVILITFYLHLSCGIDESDELGADESCNSTQIKSEVKNDEKSTSGTKSDEKNALTMIEDEAKDSQDIETKAKVSKSQNCTETAEKRDKIESKESSKPAKDNDDEKSISQKLTSFEISSSMDMNGSSINVTWSEPSIENLELIENPIEYIVEISTNSDCSFPLESLLTSNNRLTLGDLYEGAYFICIVAGTSSFQNEAQNSPYMIFIQ